MSSPDWPWGESPSTWQVWPDSAQGRRKSGSHWIGENSSKDTTSTTSNHSKEFLRFGWHSGSNGNQLKRRFIRSGKIPLFERRKRSFRHHHHRNQRDSFITTKTNMKITTRSLMTFDRIDYPWQIKAVTPPIPAPIYHSPMKLNSGMCLWLTFWIDYYRIRVS